MYWNSFADFLAMGKHGVYVWGTDMNAAMTRLEALEFMLLCHLEEGRHPR